VIKPEKFLADLDRVPVPKAPGEVSDWLQRAIPLTAGAATRGDEE
jgi:hypothetical protein